MTQMSADDLFRRAAEAEGGMPISAGARLAHIQLAVQAGRGIQIDLSSVPEEKRAAVVAEIAEVVRRASTATETAPTTPVG